MRSRATADLVVDRVYLGGPQPHWGADPLQHLLGVGLQGGIRARGGVRATRLVALRTSGTDPDWPDVLGLRDVLAIVTTVGREPICIDCLGHGNLVLRKTFDLAHSDTGARSSVPPYFLFEKAGPGREVIFRGSAHSGRA